jgi:hypothetical protein
MSSLDKSEIERSINNEYQDLSYAESLNEEITDDSSPENIKNSDTKKPTSAPTLTRSITDPISKFKHSDMKILTSQILLHDKIKDFSISESKKYILDDEPFQGSYTIYKGVERPKSLNGDITPPELNDDKKNNQINNNSINRNDFKRPPSAISLHRQSSDSPSHSSKTSFNDLSDRIFEMSSKLDNVIDLLELQIMHKKEKKRSIDHPSLLNYNAIDLIAKIQIICDSAKIFYHGKNDTQTNNASIFYLIKDVNKLSHLTSTFIFPTTEFVEYPLWICDNSKMISQTDTKWEFECQGHVNHVVLQQLQHIIAFIYETKHSISKKLSFGMSNKTHSQKLWKIKTLLDDISLYHHGVRSNTFVINTNKLPTINHHNINDTVFTFGNPNNDPIWFCDNYMKSANKINIKCICKGHIKYNLIKEIINIIK